MSISALAAKNTAVEVPKKERISQSAAHYLLGLIALWVVFYTAFISFPYLSSGAEVIYRAKLNQEMSGSIFPQNTRGHRLMIFGDSRVLAGFIPSLFDKEAAADGLQIYSFNSGYPARSEFVHQLKQMVEKSSVPDILLLTSVWGAPNHGARLFRPLPNDNEIADELFPFRHFVRDSFSFVITSKEHGGPLKFYRESRANVAKMIQDRGYYFISEQSHYPGNRLPDSFHIGSDNPLQVDTRAADPESSELSELNRIVRAQKTQCFYVPAYARAGSRAPAPDVDRPFADLLHRSTSCKLLGPNYYTYPNRLFSDETHLNREGARVYTKAIYGLLAEELRGH